ncbi:hypothetical protein ISN45_Aa05g010960 [Arabidopsis thaliana x Arabidopsis arenosa]|uniref:Uncharacterized protein n=1 Tax=Arabidopsis thaliana x Arabidopsis arenosa TaxID=1240361 RepID=A0A8T1ZM59_9BRAS|nr:hypothetical protein ISN45_Aa05g010960 [Arabidopsis thaliana x Arabidopsis arenosa]
MVLKEIPHLSKRRHPIMSPTSHNVSHQAKATNLPTSFPHVSNESSTPLHMISSRKSYSLSSTSSRAHHSHHSPIYPTLQRRTKHTNSSLSHYKALAFPAHFSL